MGAVEVWANTPSTTVSSGGTDAPSSGTVETWTVASSSSFAAASSTATPPTQFHAADAGLPGEVFAVTNISGTSWTVTRGAEGTIPVAHTAGFTVVQVESAGALAGLARTDWLNAAVMWGADPTGTADSTADIQTALNVAGPGQPVYLPSGIYKTTAPITIPPGGVLIGDYANEVSTYLDGLWGTVIQPSASWAQGTAPAGGVIVLLGQSDGSYSSVSVEQKITGIMLDCHLMTAAAIDGIQMYGGVSRAHLERVLVASPTGNGINYVSDGGGNGPDAPRLTRVNVRYPTLYGISHQAISDATYTDCLVENSTSDGWNIRNADNSTFVACRSEHSGGNGYTYTCTNSGTGAGGCRFIGCSTDASTAHGIEITSTNSSGVAVQLSGCTFRRDGYNGGSGGGGYAGIYITAYPGTVQLSGTTVQPGLADGGGGTNSPQYGLLMAGNSATRTYVIAGASYIQGATTAISDDGSEAGVYYGLDVLAATGSSGSPAVRGPRSGSANLSAGAATVTCTAVTTSSKILLTPSSTGANSGVLAVTARTSGTSFTVTSSNGSDANSFFWEILNP